MDKLLLSLYFTVLLTTLTVNSAPMPSSKIMSTIEQQQQMRQKKYGHVINNDNNNNDNDDSIKTENAESDSRMQKANKNADTMGEFVSNTDNGDDDVDVDVDVDERRPLSLYERRDEIIGEMRQQRQNKMIGYFSFNPFAYTIPPYTSPVYYPPEFFDDFASYYGYNADEEEIMSRQNPGGRRRPGSGNFKNSPIYYIRLPPTPYMFVPGLGYISQPPTYTPMPPPPPAISSFYNLPLDFISNGKPTNIYQWGSPAANQFTPQPQFVPQPSYQPTRPQRPYQRPMNPYIQESKVTNLKGAFLFNGRPEEIYVLPPSSYNSIYPDPRFVSPYY